MVTGATSLIGNTDLHLFNEGSHLRLWEKLGAHPGTSGVRAGTHFAVWAPGAERVSVIGDWNGWNRGAAPLAPRGDSGIWEGFVPGVERGARYKYHVASRYAGYRVDKADPLAFLAQTPPETASVVWTLDYAWDDAEWLARRAARQSLTAPMAIYEVHLGSWRRVPEEANRSLTYRELAESLPDYVSPGRAWAKESGMLGVYRQRYCSEVTWFSKTTTASRSRAPSNKRLERTGARPAQFSAQERAGNRSRRRPRPLAARASYLFVSATAEGFAASSSRGGTTASELSAGISSNSTTLPSGSLP